MSIQDFYCKHETTEEDVANKAQVDDVKPSQDNFKVEDEVIFSVSDATELEAPYVGQKCTIRGLFSNKNGCKMAVIEFSDGSCIVSDQSCLEPIPKEPTFEEKVLELWQRQSSDFGHDNENSYIRISQMIAFIKQYKDEF